jgi:hypothetical protein
MPGLFTEGHRLMDIALLFLLFGLAGLAWFWFDSMRALEAARGAGKQACCNAGVQFLDDTVARTALALVRDGAGRRVLRRTYRFEFSATGNDRLEGQLELLGNKVTQITMEPYQILPEVESGQPLAQQPFRQFW